MAARQSVREPGVRLHTATSLLWLLPVAGVTAASGYLALLTGAAWRARLRGHDVTSTSDQARHRFLVLVPAHDEERLVGQTLQSLRELDYPTSHVAVHVVADHCTDETASVVRGRGVEVHERHDGERGKGPALAWLLKRLDALGEPYDAVLVLDADSVVSPNFLRVMDARLARGERVIQAHYTVRDPDQSWAVGMRTAALAVRHYLRPLARTSWGGSAGLHGNGMVFTADVLRDHPWGAHLTEDIELEARLLLAGEVVEFAPDAVVRAEMPARLADAVSQNARWERGRLEVARTYVPALVRAAGRRRGRERLALLDAAVDHLVPPFSVLAAATVTAGLGAVGLRAVRPGRLGRLSTAMAAGAAASQAVYLASGLRLTGAPPSVWRSLVSAPAFVVWRLGVLRHVVEEPDSTDWVRTARNGSTEAGPMRSAVVCGVPVDDVTLDEALDRVGALVERGRTSGRSHQVATVNVDFLVHAMEDPTLLSLLQRVDLALPDGMPVVWGSRLLGIPLRERVAGSDLVPALAARCARDGHAMYLLGGAPGVAERAAALLRERHPELRVDGDSGLVVTTPEDTDAAVLERIRAHRPDVLCVALGHPKQERWIHHHRDVLGVPVMVGVGASLDFLTGTQQRAPSWMQRTGTEWLHRAIREPGRLGPRYAHDLVRFGPQLAREARLSRPSSAADAAPTVVERRGQVTLVRPGGRLELDAALLGWNEQTWPEPPPGHHVVVDLAERTSLDQQEITALVLLARRLEASGGAVTLTSVAEPVARRLLDRRLYGLLRVSSYPVALEALIGSTDVAPDGWLPPGMRARASERRSTHA